MLKPEDIGVLGGGDEDRDADALADWYRGARVDPFFDHRMAIRQRHSAGVVVVMSRVIDPARGIRVARIVAVHVHCKVAVVDSVLALVEHDVNLAHRFAGGVREFAHWPVSGLPLLQPGRVEESIHRDAADARQLTPAVARSAFVCRAFPDPETFVVRPQVALHEKDRVGVVRYRLRVVQPTLYPGVSPVGVDCIGYQFVVVIISIHRPRETHLSEVVHAADPGCFTFSPGQCREQETGKDCDDCDHHQ